MPSAGFKPFHFSAVRIDQVVTDKVDSTPGHAAPPACRANRLDQTWVLFSTLPTRALTGQQIISSDG
jgi:hypothetical protein